MALVIKTSGGEYLVRTETGETLSAHVKGSFRIKGIRTTNPVAVGDEVELERQADGTNWIKAVLPRKNYIIRRAANLSKEAHILAANVDQVLLLYTIAHPVTSTTFLDRFLATAEAYRVPVIILFNKQDLLDEAEKARQTDLVTLYSSLGYQVVLTSLSQTQDIAYVRTLLTGKVTLLSGNSGVGKSTLLNALMGESVTRTAALSEAHDAGMHTTTFSAMYPLDGGYIIDTPGIKGFGMVEMAKEEVSHYFREIFQVGRDCKYGNCLHLQEPGCAVMQAVEQGEIALSRYESYLSLLDDEEESKYR